MRRAPLNRTVGRRERTPAEWTAGVRWNPCEVCGQRSAHAHHIIDKQVLRGRGAPLWDLRGRMLLCMDCHFQHHARTRVLHLDKQHSVWGLAAEHDLTWWLERTYRVVSYRDPTVTDTWWTP